METQNKTKKTIDYSKGKIYKIVDNTNGNIYVGSTIQKLCERLRGHRKHYKSYLKGEQSFTSSFDIIKNDNYEIILIENCPCNSKEELHREERKYIESIKCVNKVIPTRTDEEYYEDNKEKIKEYNKDYYENNKEQILERQKEYYKNNKEKILEKYKEYNKNNKEKIFDRRKQYCENNKEKIREQKKKLFNVNFVILQLQHII